MLSQGSVFGKPTMVLWSWNVQESPVVPSLAVLSTALRAGSVGHEGSHLLCGHFRDGH